MNSDFIKSMLRTFPFISWYAVVSSYIYTIVYWYQFDIDPFLFLGVNDLLQQTINILVLITISAISISFIEIEFSTHNKVKHKENDNNDVMKISIFYISLFTLFLVLSFWWLNFIYFMIGCIIPYIRHLETADIMQENFENRKLRMLIASIIVLFPSHSVSYAIIHAQKIKDPDISQTLLTFKSDDCKSGCILIGKLGNKFVYKNHNNRVTFVNSDAIDFFEINKKVANKIL